MTIGGNDFKFFPFQVEKLEEAMQSYIKMEKLITDHSAIMNEVRDLAQTGQVSNPAGSWDRR